MKCRCLTWHVSDTKHVFNLRCQCYKYFERMIFDFYICICNWQVSIKTKIVKEIIWFSLHYFSVNYNNYVIFNQKKNVFYIFSSCYSYCFELIHDFFYVPWIEISKFEGDRDEGWVFSSKGRCVSAEWSTNRLLYIGHWSCCKILYSYFFLFSFLYYILFEELKKTFTHS